MPLDLFLRDAALLSGQPDQHGWRECTMQIGKLGGGLADASLLPTSASGIGTI